MVWLDDDTDRTDTQCPWKCGLGFRKDVGSRTCQPCNKPNRSHYVNGDGECQFECDHENTKVTGSEQTNDWACVACNADPSGCGQDEYRGDCPGHASSELLRPEGDRCFSCSELIVGAGIPSGMMDPGSKSVVPKDAGLGPCSCQFECQTGHIQVDAPDGNQCPPKAMRCYKCSNDDCTCDSDTQYIELVSDGSRAQCYQCGSNKRVYGSDIVGAASCKCNLNSYSPEDSNGCVLCPASAESFPRGGATEVAHCFCPEGRYMNFPTKSYAEPVCIDCTNNYYCLGPSTKYDRVPYRREECPISTQMAAGVTGQASVAACAPTTDSGVYLFVDSDHPWDSRVFDCPTLPSPTAYEYVPHDGVQGYYVSTGTNISTFTPDGPAACQVRCRSGEFEAKAGRQAGNPLECTCLNGKVTIGSQCWCPAGQKPSQSSSGCEVR